MKKLGQRFKIGIFMGILILPSLLWMGMKLVAPDSYRKLNYDLGENRTREPFPDVLPLKDYTVRLEAYYNDNAPFRSTLISLEQRISGAMEGIYEDHLQSRLALLIFGDNGDTVMDISNLQQEGETTSEEVLEALAAVEHVYEPVEEVEATYTSYGYTIYQCKICGDSYRDDFVGKLVDNSYLAPKIVGEGVILGRFDWLLYSGDDSIAYYTGRESNIKNPMIYF
ncbi:hypothetical protein D5278_04680 [bacterium 1XD21-13]|nr:hypothetical protein [bacterium 1XD21-13]